MLYSVLIYDSESDVEALSQDENQAKLRKHIALQNKLQGQGDLGPVARLMPTTTAVTLKPGTGEPLVLDGPFTETKEQLVGFYIFESASLEEAIEAARMLPIESGALEIRPIAWFNPGVQGQA